MIDVETDDDRILEALHSCPKLCTHLGLQGLACLAACSNSLQKECASCCTREAVALTAGAIEALATATSRQQEQQLQAVVWLLHEVPAAATNSLTDQLTMLQDVPLHSARALVAAGVRITYAQLVAAAHSMVAGVEVWVQAQQQLGEPSDIPEPAVSICCYDPWVSCFKLVDRFCLVLTSCVSDTARHCWAAAAPATAGVADPAGVNRAAVYWQCDQSNCRKVPDCGTGFLQILRSK
jgi:hypothetical protein